MASGSMRLSIAAESNIGCARALNEDNFCYSASEDGKYLLAVVADGVGGHERGEVASYLCCHTLLLEWRALFATGETEFPDTVFAGFLSRAIQKANSAIYRLNREYQLSHPMGTTVVAVVFTPQMAIIAHMGDSRCYCRRGDNMFTLTYDHTLLNEMHDLPESRRPAQLPASNIITRAVGSYRRAKMEVHTFFRMPEDRYLLCSDGLFNLVTDDEINTVLRDCRNPREALAHLIPPALCRGGTDNITVVCAMPENPRPEAL